MSLVSLLQGKFCNVYNNVLTTQKSKVSPAYLLHIVINKLDIPLGISKDCTSFGFTEGRHVIEFSPLFKTRKVDGVDVVNKV